jgi:phosphoribosylaminoimidazolecarboxamide formyltransferase/IMP cyclohydrolase
VTGAAFAAEGGERAQWEGLFDETPVELTKEEKTQHMKELKGVCCSSDAFFPFPDNVHRAYRSGATYLAAPGGSIMDAECIKAADEKDIVFVHHNMRLVGLSSALVTKTCWWIVPPLGVLMDWHIGRLGIEGFGFQRL